MGHHAGSFTKHLGKTHFLGRPVPAGNIWKARGDHPPESSFLPSALTLGTPEITLSTIIEGAKEILQEYKDPVTGAPDPSFVLRLPNDVYSSSNLFAVQKLFEGRFQFDVFFESASAKQQLSGTYLRVTWLYFWATPGLSSRCA
jgi:mannosyl-oligosaccharide glucosidase